MKMLILYFYFIQDCVQLDAVIFECGRHFICFFVNVSNHIVSINNVNPQNILVKFFYTLTVFVFLFAYTLESFYLSFFSTSY